MSQKKYLLFGGAAGGGKSWMGCEWLILQCMRHPNTRWFMGRAELKQLLLTTVKTFFKVASHHGLVSGIDYKYNQTKNTFTFLHNQSEIVLMELAYKPSDPEYTTLGSLEFTGGFIDEAGELDQRAFDTLKTRLGRQQNAEQNIMPRMFMSCNPVKNWLYKYFYKPHKDKIELDDTCFIPAMYSDNPHLSIFYEQQLQSIADPIRKARLMQGEWEFDSTENELFQYNCLRSMFTNEFIPKMQKNYITIDAARMGSDSTVIIRWNGFRAEEFIEFEKNTTVMVSEVVKQMAVRYKIPQHNIICDDDGVGGGVRDELGCVRFNNGAKAKEIRGDKENYRNLKTQCYYRFAQRVNRNEIFIAKRDKEERIIEELDAIRRTKMDKDGPLEIASKEEIKRQIGHSPDYADALMMREYFELNVKVSYVDVK